MKNTNSVRSILDTDFYKISMSYSYMVTSPDAETVYTFTDRDKCHYDMRFLEELTKQINSLSELYLTDEEFEALQKSNVSRFIPTFYWEWLKQFRFEPSKIHYGLDDNGCLYMEVTDKTYKATLYEIHLLAIVSDIRNKWLGYDKYVNYDDVLNLLDKKIDFSNENELSFSEFGTRRRFSYDIQDIVVKHLAEKAKYCTGTSNIHLALKYNMPIIGTMGHEYIMNWAAFSGGNGIANYGNANKYAIDAWQRTYNGDLGVYLPDTFTVKVALNNFTLQDLKLWDAFRIDSGDEYEVGNMILEKYKENRINPKTKSIIFSNALDFKKFKEIHDYFKNSFLSVSAGIGGDLVNRDVFTDTIKKELNYKPANIVIKASKARFNENSEWINLIKLSNDKGKHTGDKNEIEFAKKLLKIE